MKDCDARLYVSILTRLHLLGSPLRAAPNLTVTAIYPRLSRALMLPKSQFETNAVVIELFTSRNRLSVTIRAGYFYREVRFLQIFPLSPGKSRVKLFCKQYNLQRIFHNPPAIFVERKKR